MPTWKILNVNGGGTVLLFKAKQLTMITNLYTVNENSLEYFKFFPNPTNGKLNIDFEDYKNLMDIEINDAQGSLLFNQIAKNTIHKEIKTSILEGEI